jgi:hypothetical protein
MDGMMSLTTLLIYAHFWNLFISNRETRATLGPITCFLINSMD